jgi:hypothetical protein
LKAVKKVGVLPVAIPQVEVLERVIKVSHLCIGSECISSFYPKVLNTTCPFKFRQNEGAQNSDHRHKAW